MEEEEFGNDFYDESSENKKFFKKEINYYYNFNYNNCFILNDINNYFIFIIKIKKKKFKK